MYIGYCRLYIGIDDGQMTIVDLLTVGWQLVTGLAPSKGILNIKDKISKMRKRPAAGAVLPVTTG